MEIQNNNEYDEDNGPDGPDRPNRCDNITNNNTNVLLEDNSINIFDIIDEIEQLNKTSDSYIFASNYSEIKQKITMVDEELSLDLTAQYEHYSIQELFNLIETKYNDVNMSNLELKPIELNKFLSIIKILEIKLQNENINWNEIK